MNFNFKVKFILFSDVSHVWPKFNHVNDLKTIAIDNEKWDQSFKSVNEEKVIQKIWFFSFVVVQVQNEKRASEDEKKT